MSAYDKLAVCLFNFKCKAPERERERESERVRERKECDGGRGEREMPTYCWQRERSTPQMLDVSVCGTDKALHKFESRMPTSWGLGGEALAAGQVLDRGGEGGGGGQWIKGDKA